MPDWVIYLSVFFSGINFGYIFVHATGEHKNKRLGLFCSIAGFVCGWVPFFLYKVLP